MAILLMLFVGMMVFAGTAFAEEGVAVEQTTEQAQEEGMSVQAIAALIGAALAFGLGALGAGSAIGRVGSAAMGAIAEKPSIAGQALIFVALAEGIVVFGFITALMILQNV